MSDLGTTPNIPDHELLRLIGRGSYGEVWLARNIMGTLRAVKIVSRSAFDHARPYEREFAGLQKFEPISRTHASQLDILHIGQNQGEGYFYYVMELADNAADEGRSATEQHPMPEAYRPRTLRSEMDRRGPLAPTECVELGLSLSTALAHLHKNGLVHRDIKPSNIIYVNNQVKLADIGLVSAVDATRSYVGTVGYAPYEGPGTPPADIYSLGKVLYEAVTGRDRQEFPELPTQISGTAKEQDEFLELNEVLIKACDDDPRRRYQTAEQLHEDLLALRSGKSLVRLRTIERRFQWAKRVGVAALLLVLLITPAYLYEGRQTRRVKKLAAENLALAQEAQRNELSARENLYAADIGLAHQALQADNLRQARDLLEKEIPKPGEPELRGFEWRYLWKQCQGEELFTLRGHEGSADSVAFSPDGRLLASASMANAAARATVIIWDLAARQARATLTAHTDDVSCVCFSPNGKLLATASQTAVYVWNTTNFQQQVRSLPGSAVIVQFSPTGEYLATAGTNGLILWDARTWTVWKTLDSTALWSGDLADVTFSGLRLAFSPDGTRLGVTSNDGIRIYSFPELRQIEILKDSPSHRFLAFSPDGHMLASDTAGEKNVRLWHVDAAKEAALLSGHSDTVFAATFSPDGGSLITCSADQTIKIWNVARGELVRTLKGHAEEVYNLAISLDGKMLASVGKDGSVKVWDASSGPSRTSSLGDVAPLGFNSEGDLVVHTKTNHMLAAFDPESRRTVSAQRFLGQRNKWRCRMALRNLFRDGHTIAFPMQSLDPQPEEWIELWDLSRRQFLCALEPVEGNRVVYAPHRGLLATCTSNLTVALWEIPNGTRKCVLTNALAPAAFSPDGTMLATWRNPTGAPIDLWNVTGETVHYLSTLNGEPGLGVDFSPDGRIIALSGADSLIRFRAIPSGRLLATLTGHKRAGIDVRFSPDGRTLASMADDGTVRLWHVATGRELINIQIPGEDIQQHDLEFSSDGRSLAATRGDPSIGLTEMWFAPSLAEIAVAEGKEYRLLAQDAATWHAVGKALEERGRFEEAVEAFRQAVHHSTSRSDLEELSKSALRHRSKLLMRLGCIGEAAADNEAALNLPRRDPHAPFQLIDLSAYFNALLDSDSLSREIPPLGFLAEWPRGIQSMPAPNAVSFDVRGVVQLNNKDQFLSVPNSVNDIRVRQTCRRLTFLHATHFSEPDNTEIGVYVVHYAGGKQEEIPIVYGSDLRDWSMKSDSAEVQSATVAWSRTNAVTSGMRLFCRVWKNPHPETEIQSLDFVSKLTHCAPFLLAITAE